jgi:hypothetical protein
MKQMHPSLHAFLGLTLVAVTIVGFGCSNDTTPIRDAEETDEILCDGVDNDNDDRIDEGLLNACLGCTDILETSCVNTTITLQATEPNAVSPVALQYRIHNPEPRVIMGYECVFERVQSHQPIVLEQALTLSQDGQPGTWSTDPLLVDNAFIGIELDGERSLNLIGSIDSTNLRLEVKSPAPQSESAKEFVTQCAAHFESTAPVSTALELQAPRELFIGGSTQLEADPSEIATSFFVLSGASEPGSLMMSKLTQSRPYLPDAIRCTISKSVADSQPIAHNGFQLSAQTSVASALSFAERTRPAPLRSFQSIEFAQDVVRVNLSDLDQWGSPQSVELTRSGEVQGAYESQKLTCNVTAGSGSLEIAPEAVFPPWLGEALPQEILRLNWTNTTAPFEAHPNLFLREALTIQKRKSRD